MKMRFENVLTVGFFIVSIMVLAPACSNVANLTPEVAPQDGSVLINP
jgi:hypothetical protein